MKTLKELKEAREKKVKRILAEQIKSVADYLENGERGETFLKEAADHYENLGCNVEIKNELTMIKYIINCPEESSNKELSDLIEKRKVKYKLFIEKHIELVENILINTGKATETNLEVIKHFSTVGCIINKINDIETEITL